MPNPELRIKIPVSSPGWPELAACPLCLKQPQAAPISPVPFIEKTYHYHRIIQLLKLEEPD